MSRGYPALESDGCRKRRKRSEAAKPPHSSTNHGGLGVYMPPSKLARTMKEVKDDKNSLEYQRLTWEALKNSINGLVNKLNATNIRNIVREFFGENLIRGRGLFCRSCMKLQTASPSFTDKLAALVAVINSKIPDIGNLLLRRIILQFKTAFYGNDKPRLESSVKFIAHLVNQQVATELVALELLILLLDRPTDDRVEIAVGFVKECGSILLDLSPKALRDVFERFRVILHEGEVDKRVLFLIEGLFAIRKANFRGYPAVRPELDLVDPQHMITHDLSLQDKDIDPEFGLNIFKQDPKFLDNEMHYEELKNSILGDESSEDEDKNENEDDNSDRDCEDSKQLRIIDETKTDIVNLRRTIYQTIMSTLGFEEAGHLLLTNIVDLHPGVEMELCVMILQCCLEEKLYNRFYSLLARHFCKINKVYKKNFEKCFIQQYSTVHRLETNKLLNAAKFFAELLASDALPWQVLGYVSMTEEDTTSSSRIFLKYLFQQLTEELGIHMLSERLNNPAMQESFKSILPKDNPRNTRFAINFFTSIGLGGITKNLRDYYARRKIPQ